MSHHPPCQLLRGALVGRRPLFVCALALLFTGNIGSILSGEDEPIFLTEEIEPPVRIAYVQPAYPDELKRAGIEGKVGLQIVVGRGGGVDEMTIIRSHPAFDQVALDAVKQWKYKPATKAGKPVAVFFTVTSHPEF